MKSDQHKVISYSVSPKVFNKLRREAFKCGVSMAGLTRLLMENALSMKSDIYSRPPHIKRERVISDVTIRIQKGIRVKIV